MRSGAMSPTRPMPTKKTATKVVSAESMIGSPFRRGESQIRPRVRGWFVTRDRPLMWSAQRIAVRARRVGRNHVEGAALYLLEDAAQVRAEDAQGDELYAREKRHGDEDRR